MTHPLAGRKQSPEHVANRVAAIRAGAKTKGVPLSEEHRLKIAAALRGRKRSPALCAKMRARVISAETRAKTSATLKGKPLSAETKAKMSAAKKGKPLSEEHCAKLSIAHKRNPHTPEHAAKLLAARKGRALSTEHRVNISRAQIGRVQSTETRRKLSEIRKQSWADGRYSVVITSRYTKLAQALHTHLAAQGLTLEPEVRFGRYTVDLYDRDHHVAYEADGKFWHDRAENRNPGCHARRDEYLMDRFGLSVVHVPESEIRALTGWPAKASQRVA